ncbi:tRNA preQ1(34) S-adenosylmethionine ribosyltransferase-isomerase QueA [Methyloligella sp. 2.7D]|uniref:tRNA preQ1(34) S-adenosylmethionine ribosyltransferase-isomerase QueA n=1 Tax=unclassified Methyloligella TaxID=2625955 RepID=UPI00157C57D2|nr:tRNA preQ1(34) S-adenosylmethionine ribosyltransferase-isomerase QueA [Methyloligella sp. GL2]QKP77700.1 tRNA preQ1(34) S-adenosylmethionine ribosyltransferase-isomerase QueA [Methyloligella sp. GL2]
MRVDAFDFELPEALIALRPAVPRDAARLLVVDGATGALEDKQFRDLAALLRPGDALVFNDTRVIPAELHGTRTRGEAVAEISVNLTKRLDATRWQAFARPAKRLQPGDRIQFGTGNGACLAGSLDATVEGKGEGGEIALRFDLEGAALDEAIASIGAMPLPPYIASRRRADASDVKDYQTVYAAHEGAVAAPTAGLHFTDDLIAELEGKGISTHRLTLHVGPGTFLPVKADDTEDHVMHSETGVLSEDVAEALNDVRARGGRIVAVGTTALRLLESAADETGHIHPFTGDTDIFITPGYRFRAVDLLLTNFHLPRSTLFMLVSAFSGLEAMQAAYAHAIRQRYRFYSYGDACLLSPGKTEIE